MVPVQSVSSEPSLQSGAPLQTPVLLIHLALWASIQRLPPSQMTGIKHKKLLYNTMIIVQKFNAILMDLMIIIQYSMCLEHTPR